MVDEKGDEYSLKDKYKTKLITVQSKPEINKIIKNIKQGADFSDEAVKNSLDVSAAPTFGSMVQNGKLADCALAFDRQLKRVDLPTLGRPTMPHCNAMISVIFVFWCAKLLTIFQIANRHSGVLTMCTSICGKGKLTPEAGSSV